MLKNVEANRFKKWSKLFFLPQKGQPGNPNTPGNGTHMVPQTLTLTHSCIWTSHNCYVNMRHA